MASSAPRPPFRANRMNVKKKAPAAMTRRPTRNGVRSFFTGVNSTGGPATIYRFAWTVPAFGGRSVLSKPRLEEHPHIRVLRLPQPGRGALLHDGALGEEGDLVRHVERAGDVVADDHAGDAELALGLDDHLVHVV